MTTGGGGGRDDARATRDVGYLSERSCHVTAIPSHVHSPRRVSRTAPDGRDSRASPRARAAVRGRVPSPPTRARRGRAPNVRRPPIVERLGGRHGGGTLRVHLLLLLLLLLSSPPASFPGPGPAYGGANTYADAQAIAPPSPRRVFLGVLGTTALALGGNFLGVTGALLDANPDLAARARLDIIYPVRGLKRCYNPEKGYEFSYPAAYLGDATMVSRAATQRERANPLDPPPPWAPPPPPRRSSGRRCRSRRARSGPWAARARRTSP